MKICIPHKPHAVGGPSIFVKNLKEGLTEHGVSLTYDIDDKYDLLLVISTYDGFLNRKLRKKKSEGVKIVQRLDGIYTFATSKFLYPLYNFGMKYVLHNLADHVIYQSKYSKFLCDKFLGKPQVDWSIIYNGVDVKKFNPNGEKYEFDKEFTLFAMNIFRRRIALYPILKAFNHIKSQLYDVQLVIAGPIKNELHKLLPRNDEHIKHLGEIPHDQVPLYERGADVFMFPIRSACPNLLIESIACGLPVACYDIGSNREILGDNKAGVLCDPSVEKKVYLYFMLMPDPKNLAKATLKVLDKLAYFRKSARERAVRLFSLEKMVGNYIKVFEKVLAN